MLNEQPWTNTATGLSQNGFGPVAICFLFFSQVGCRLPIGARAREQPQLVSEERERLLHGGGEVLAAAARRALALPRLLRHGRLLQLVRGLRRAHRGSLRQERRRSPPKKPGGPAPLESPSTNNNNNK